MVKDVRELSVNSQLEEYRKMAEDCGAGHNSVDAGHCDNA